MDRIKHDFDFSIYIDDSLYFHEQEFPAFDFLFCLNQWLLKNTDEDFEYNCIETDDNPLITVVCISNLWKINSKWENFHAEQSFSKQKIAIALQALVEENGFVW